MESEIETQEALAVVSTIQSLDATVTADAPPIDPAAGGSGAGMLRAQRYETRGVLGEGGMGIVHRAWDQDLMREVAVKQLRAHRRGDARRLREFLWEARVTAHLDHPNIVPIHELGLTDEDQLYFTMKYVRGRSLDQLLTALRDGDPDASEKYSLPRRLRVFLQLCQAIAFAHSRGVLHRDLKPANVMLGEHGEVLVMDWGIAVPLPGESGHEFGELVPEGIEHDAASLSGTPLYMSPEQARGEALDARSDVFTLGVILYELVALKHAYEGDNIAAIVLKVAAGESIPIEQAAPEVSSSLQAVVRKAMATDPAQRYATVDALMEDVEAVLDGATPKAEDANAAKRFQRFYLQERNPYVNRMRAIDVDLLGVGSGLAGAGLALLWADLLEPWSWLFLLAALPTLGYPFLTWARTARAQSAEKRRP